MANFPGSHQRNNQTMQWRFFALRTLRHHGLSEKALHTTFSAKIWSKLTYASPAWCGFISTGASNQLQAFLRKASKFNYYPSSNPSFSELVVKADTELFHKVTSNPLHCLHPLLPPLKISNYDLRKRGHGFSLPLRDDRNFINRTLFRLI